MKTAALLSLVVLSACSGKEGAAGGPAPGATCTKVGEVCRITESKLGVCTADDRKPGPAGSSLVCVSQH